MRSASQSLATFQYPVSTPAGTCTYPCGNIHLPHELYITFSCSSSMHPTNNAHTFANDRQPSLGHTYNDPARFLGQVSRLYQLLPVLQQRVGLSPDKEDVPPRSFTAHTREDYAPSLALSFTSHLPLSLIFDQTPSLPLPNTKVSSTQCSSHSSPRH